MSDPLNDGEWLLSIQAAMLRQSMNMGDGRRSANMPGGETVQEALRRHTVGVQGEMRFAKLMGAWPTGLFEFDAPDLVTSDGVMWEVKATPRAEGRLIIQPNKCFDDRRYVLLTGSGGDFRVRGSIMGAEAKKRPVTDGANNGRPAIWIDADQLEPWVK